MPYIFAFPRLPKLRYVSLCGSYNCPIIRVSLEIWINWIPHIQSSKLKEQKCLKGKPQKQYSFSFQAALHLVRSMQVTGATHRTGQCTKGHSHVCSSVCLLVGQVPWERKAWFPNVKPIQNSDSVLLEHGPSVSAALHSTWNYINEWLAGVFDKIITFTYFHSTLPSVSTCIEATAWWGWRHSQSCFIEISQSPGNYVTCQRHSVHKWRGHNLAPQPVLYSFLTASDNYTWIRRPSPSREGSI